MQRIGASRPQWRVQRGLGVHETLRERRPSPRSMRAQVAVVVVVVGLGRRMERSRWPPNNVAWTTSRPKQTSVLAAFHSSLSARRKRASAAIPSLCHRSQLSCYKHSASTSLIQPHHPWRDNAVGRDCASLLFAKLACCGGSSKRPSGLLQPRRAAYARTRASDTGIDHRLGLLHIGKAWWCGPTRLTICAWGDLCAISRAATTGPAVPPSMRYTY